jgi:ribosomal-protein-alanine N-acetyltransferase
MIIKLNNEDLDEIYDIEYSNRNSINKNLIEESIKDVKYHFFGYRKNDKLVGYYYMRIILDICELFQITVHKNSQNTGIGKLLLNHCIAFAKNNHCRCIELEVRENNIPAKKLYLNNNFKIITKRKNYYNNPIEDAILMTLNL